MIIFGSLGRLGHQLRKKPGGLEDYRGLFFTQLYGDSQKKGIDFGTFGTPTVKTYKWMTCIIPIGSKDLLLGMQFVWYKLGDKVSSFGGTWIHVESSRFEIFDAHFHSIWRPCVFGFWRTRTPRLNRTTLPWFLFFWKKVTFEIKKQVLEATSSPKLGMSLCFLFFFNESFCCSSCLVGGVDVKLLQIV